MLEIAFSPAESHAIKTNSFCKIYLKGQDHITCKKLQEIIGNGDDHKPVLAASQIRTCNEAIILVDNKLPYKESMTQYFNHWIFRKRTRIEPYALENKIPFKQPPIIEVD